MSRPLRIEYPGAWYHVMNRGRRKEDVFLSRTDYESFLEILREASIGWNIKIAAYCLMPNHYHLLVTTPEGNISRCMRHINGVYTQRFNRQHQTDGQVFRADSHLLEVLRYIHRNPVRSGLAEDPEHYPWSSHQGYVSSASKWAWLEKEFLLSMLSAREIGQRAAYKDFVCQHEPENVERFYALKNLPSIMGSDTFKEWLKEGFQHLGFLEEVPQSRLFFPTAAKIIAAICAHFQVTPEQIAISRRGTENLPRDVAIYLVRLLGRETLTEVGRNFGVTNYSTVGSTVARMKRRLKNDRALQKHLQEIRNTLDKSQRQI